MTPMPQIKEKPTLAEWQVFVRELVAEKGFTEDPNEIFVLFTEEVGELAKELRKKWKYGAEGVRESAEGEFADVFMYLLDLANHFGVDLEAALRRKVAKNDGRTWDY